MFHYFQFILVFAMMHPFLSAAQNNKKIDGYTLKNVNGYNVFVENKALKQNNSRTEEALTLLSRQLAQIDELDIKDEVLRHFKRVPIFMDWQQSEGGAVYHPSKDWLIQNGYIAEKEKSVNIVNINNFIDWSQQNQPYMMLHELTHAYHDIVLGDNYAPLLQAYNAAMRQKLYEAVDYYDGSNILKNKKAYAATNDHEYFSELTEAFFGKNDYYPFNRADLAKHDPRAYQLLQDIWQDKNKAIKNIESTVFEPNRYYSFSTAWQGEGKSLDVVNDGKNNQLQLAQTANVSGQQWKITDIGGGYYRLTTAWQGENKSLDVVNDGDNNKLQLAQTADVSGQHWKITDIGDGYYRLTTAWQGENNSLDVINDGKNNQLQLAPTADVSGQKWKIKLQ
jgi:hypothetical protein